jgi:hypothetical protein
MERHLTILTVLFGFLGACGMLVATIVLVALTGGGLISGDRTALLITSGIGVAVAGLLAAVSLPSIIVAVGLHRRRRWSRMLGLILACFQLLNMPFGTVIGVYALWVLLQEEATHLLNRDADERVQVV